MKSVVSKTNFYLILALLLIILGVFAYYHSYKKESLSFEPKEKPFTQKWVNCRNSCDNYFDQSKFEICKEDCTHKYLL